MKKISFLVFITVLLSCTRENLSHLSLNDEKLYHLATDSSNVYYYQNGQILSPAGNSPHGTFRLWFNTTAYNVLDASLELPAGAVFPDSSLIVKQLLQSGVPAYYSVMYKRDGGWSWGEYYADGEVFYSVGKAGGACVSCHSQTPNRDMIRTFDLH